MRIEDLNITQESVNDFFDEIDIDALLDSFKLSLEELDIHPKGYVGIHEEDTMNWGTLNHLVDQYYDERDKENY